jgi:hypothetical protein
MSGLVFFDDDTNNDVLDEWMNNDSATLAKGASLGSELPAAETKGGLGYADSAKGAKQNKAAVDSKQQKQQQLLNKKKQNITKVDHDDDELHGVVTDMGEESRTSVVSRKDKDALNQKRKADSAQKSNKKQKVQTGAQGSNSASTASATNSGGTNRVGNEAKNQASVGKVSAGTGSTPSGKKDINSGTNTSGAAAVSDDADKRVNSRIRKRTKTRSKQKNIRKDNRSDTLKPAHLVVKNKDYQGRPLTDRTKAVLGVV